MKKTLLAFCLAVGSVLSISAQEKVKVSDKDLPTTVQTTFKSQYPEASDADWTIKEDKYKVHFKLNGNKQIAAYDKAGMLLSQGTEIKESELPVTVTTSTKALYANRAIDEVYKMEKNAVTQYLVKLKGEPKTKILYSADGQVIKE